MKNLGLYLYYDLGVVLVLVGLPLLIFLAIKRRRPELWRLLIAAEVVLLFISLANCGVPGSWKDFWISESVDYGLAALAAGGSIALALRNQPTPVLARVLKSPQLITFFIVTIVIALIVHRGI